MFRGSKSKQAAAKPSQAQTLKQPPQPPPGMPPPGMSFPLYPMQPAAPMAAQPFQGSATPMQAPYGGSSGPMPVSYINTGSQGPMMMMQQRGPVLVGSQGPMGAPILMGSAEPMAPARGSFQRAIPMQGSAGPMQPPMVYGGSSGPMQQLMPYGGSSGPFQAPQMQMVYGGSTEPMVQHVYGGSSGPMKGPLGIVGVPRKAASKAQQPAGVGLYFKTDKLGRYYVEMVLENTSAASTGVVKPGDILELVQNESVVGKSLIQLRQMILGPPGTYVNLSFLREMDNDAFRFDVDLLRGDPGSSPAGDGKNEAGKRSSASSVSSSVSSGIHQLSTIQHNNNNNNNNNNHNHNHNHNQHQHQQQASRSNLNNSSSSNTSGRQQMLFGTSSPRDLHGSGNNSQQERDIRAVLHEAEQERDVFRKKYLAEQRLHLEAERDLQQARESNRELGQQIDRLAGDARSPADVREAQQAQKREMNALTQTLKRQQMALAAHEADVNSEMVPRELLVEQENHNLKLEEQIQHLQDELAMVLQQVSDKGGGGHVSQAHQLAVLALPPVVSLLAKFCDEAENVSSSTWALMRAEDHVARLSAFYHPITPAQVVRHLTSANDVTSAHNAVCSMSILSCDPGARKQLIADRSAIPCLFGLLCPPQGMLQGGMATEEVLCARFASMALGNFSLEELGREDMINFPSGVDKLVTTIRSQDPEASCFALLCVGNLFMSPNARHIFIKVPGAVETLVECLEATSVHALRYAVGTVRNLASDDASREALLSVPGLSPRLSELAMHRNVKIKDHAEAAIGNLNIRSSVSMSRQDSMRRSTSAVSDYGNGDRRASGVSEAPSSGGINLKNIIPGVDVESAIGNLFRH